MMNKVVVHHSPRRRVVCDMNFAHVKPGAAAHRRAQHVAGNQLQKNRGENGLKIVSLFQQSPACSTQK